MNLWNSECPFVVQNLIMQLLDLDELQPLLHLRQLQVPLSLLVTNSLRPVECVTSTITGKCVSFFKIGTAEMSNVLRVALFVCADTALTKNNFDRYLAQ